MTYDREAHIRSYDGSEYRRPADDPDPECWYLTYWDIGRSWCRPCEEWHRLPECVLEGEVVRREITDGSTLPEEDPSREVQ